MLCSIYQRYKLKAIHNLMRSGSNGNLLCSIYQRYKLKAIHNIGNPWATWQKAVLNISKIQTESNSQPWGPGIIWWLLCSIYQRYKLKAIHNSLWAIFSLLKAVLNISKIQTESNSQLAWVSFPKVQCCAQYIKDTNWKQFTTIDDHYAETMLLCSIYQRYKLKAIHNMGVSVLTYAIAVLNISKIQTESNSQRIDNCTGNREGCAQYIKDTNWKQFTTVKHFSSWPAVLCSIYQRYKLKAIHNAVDKTKPKGRAVLNISKIQTESNSQQARWI